jgi:uncharacterized protein YybS (DUF2232 family)
MNQPGLGEQSTWTALGLFVVLAAAAAFTPLTGLVVWLMPVPFIVLSIKSSKLLSLVLAVVMAGVLVAAGLGVATVVFTLGVYLVGWVMGESMHSADNAFPSLITGTLVFVMLSLVGLAFLDWSGFHLEAELLRQSAISLQMYEPELHLNPVQVEQMSSEVVHRITALLPAIVVILSFLAAVINYVVARSIAGFPRVSAQPLLSAWRLPSSVIWVYIVTTFCVVFNIGHSTPYWWSAVNNAFSLTGFFIGVQGIAFIWRRIRHTSLRYLWIILIMIAALFLNSLFILIGLFDSMLYARRMR